MAFTVVFEGSIRNFAGNPMTAETAFGKVQTISIGDVCDLSDVFRDALDEIADGAKNPDEIAQAALDAENTSIQKAVAEGRAKPVAP